MQEGILTISSNAGRYAVHSAEGPDLTSGMTLEIFLDGRWIAGSVEHAGALYASSDSHRASPGYYFIGKDGSVCGLCVGMLVRLS